MWANAQRDGRPAEYRWRPLLNRGRHLYSAGRPRRWALAQSVQHRKVWLDAQYGSVVQ